MKYEEAMQRLKDAANPANLEGQARYGINTASALGVSRPALRSLAKEIGRDHDLAGQLWASGVHEARMLAALVEDPRAVTEAQMEAWVLDFNSWDLCDGCCADLFDRTPFAHAKAVEWSGREEEFVKRAGFVLMAELATHDKKAPDEAFLAFLPLIEREAEDSRNFVRKAVNWALRGIGKRNIALNQAAIACARRVADQGGRSAKWVASDALRELTGDAVQQSLRAREKKKVGIA